MSNWNDEGQTSRRTLPPLRVLSDPRPSGRGGWSRTIGLAFGVAFFVLVLLVALSSLVWLIFTIWRAIL